MTDPTQSPSPAGDPPPESGSSQAPGERRLAHPPSDRYRAAEAAASAAAAAKDVPDPAASIARGVAVAFVAAIVGGAAIVWLGAILTLTSGLLAAAGLTGGAVGLALRWGAAHHMTRRRRTLAAVILAVGAVGLGQIGIWQYALAEGGVLPFVDYLGEVFGPLVPAELAAAAVVGWLAAR